MKQNTVQIDAAFLSFIGTKMAMVVDIIPHAPIYRADSRIAPSQWETALQSNAVSHWLGANLKSVLHLSRETRVYINLPSLIYPNIVNTMVVDDMAMQTARASAAIVLT